MAETNSLLNCRTPQGVPGVRIPPSPPDKKDDGCIVFFFGVWRSPASAPALGAGGRRFESFCPDLKIKELQGFVTPFFWPFQKSGHKKDTLFRNISYRFPILFSNSPAKKDTLFGLFQKMPPPKGRHHANKLLMSTERCKYTTFSIFTTLL